jgi:regulator of sirC expression with transglutaminase-like and TPR domain
MNRQQQQLAALARQPEDDIDLCSAALTISRLFQPGVDPDGGIGQLELLAAAARARMPDDGDLLRQVAALNEFLFEELGFSGNQDDFYDPRNSFLDQVIERRMGIPISLSLLYCELATRLGIPAFGVSFPAHFLVRVGRGATALMLDVYAGGVALPEEELDRRLADVYGKGTVTVRSNPAVLRPAGKREILVRMLRNLIGVYRARGDQANLLEALTAVLNLSPNLPDELYQRGLLYRELGYASAAVADLRRFVEVAEDAKQIAYASGILGELADAPPKLH